MSMKKILMAAAAVTALTAGVANAATIDNTTTIAGKALTPDVTGSSATITSNPFTIATELNVGTGLTVPSALVIKPTASSVGQGQHVITYNIKGGTFTTTGVTAGASGSLTLTTSGGTSSSVASLNTVNANSISFNITIASGEFLTSASFANVLKLGTARATVAIDGNLTTAAGNPVDGGAIASKTVVDYRSGYKFTATAATTNTTLSIASGYKKFGVAPALASANNAYAELASAVGFAVNTGTDTSDVVYSVVTGNNGATTTTAAVPSNLQTAVLTLSGDVSAFNPVIVTAGTAVSQTTASTVDTGTTNVFTYASIPAAIAQATAIAPTALVVLNPKTTPVAGNASSYSITPVVTMLSGYTAPTFAPAALASVTLEGTNFYAPGVGDGSNGISYTIRLGNRASAAASGVVVTALNSTGTPTATSCSLGSVPASGELLITSASLKTCMGSFGRVDLRITVQASTSSLTAKMRSVAAGVVNEQALGGGSDVASMD